MLTGPSARPVRRGQNVMVDTSKPPAKHLPHGNYARSDWFEARCKELEKELDDMLTTLKAANDLIEELRHGR